jgi:hypothetical protein
MKSMKLSRRLLFLLLALALVCFAQVLGHGHGHDDDHIDHKNKNKKEEEDTSGALMISSIVQSTGSIAIELYNPTCQDVRSQKHGIELQLVYCETNDGEATEPKQDTKKKSSGSSRDCAKKHAKLRAPVPKLQTLVVCSNDIFGDSSSRTKEEEEKCDVYTDTNSSLLDASKNLVEIKLVKSNATATIIDRVLDTELFSPKEVTLKKFSQFSQERRDGSGGDGDELMKEEGEGEVTEMSSIWLYKPYATYSLLGCHSTKHEEICQNTVPQACPPADIDSFRAFSIEEIARSQALCLESSESSSSGDSGDVLLMSSDDLGGERRRRSAEECAPFMYGETISTYGYITGKANWLEDRDQELWMLTIQNATSSSGHVTTTTGVVTNNATATSSIRVAIQLPVLDGKSAETEAEGEGREEEGGGEGSRAFDTLMKAHWLNGLELGSKISFVGRLTVDDYGVLIDNVLNIAVLDQIQSAQKLMPDDLSNSREPTYIGEGNSNGNGASRSFLSRSAMEPLAAAAIALCGTLILIASALFVLIQFKKDVGRGDTIWK